jgi:hypothetical protein
MLAQRNFNLNPLPHRAKSHIGDYAQYDVTPRKKGVYAKLIVKIVGKSMSFQINIYNIGLFITHFGLEVDICQK